MKTSNYILLSFVIIMLIGVLVLVKCAKEHKTGKIDDSKNIEYPLGKFNTLVVDSTSNIRVELYSLDGEKYKSNTLAVFVPQKVKAPQKLYRLSNDTLFITITPKMKLSAVRLFCEEGISSINLKVGNLDVIDYAFDTLFLWSSGGSITFNHNIKRLRKLDVEAKSGSNINLYLMKTNIDELNLRLVLSTFNLSQEGYSNNVTIDKDSASVYHFYNIR